MHRFDLFGRTHQGLRTALYDTALQIQQTNFLCAEQTEASLNGLHEIILRVTEQAKQQDLHVLTALQAFEPSVVCILSEEHVSIGGLAKKLLALTEQVERANNEADKQEAGQLLSETVPFFTGAQLRHMAHEEDIGNTILWRYYTDGELQAILARAEEATAPWIRAFFHQRNHQPA